MSADEKKAVRLEYEEGKIRCLVSTTALGAGVNLPASHVIVRDLTFGRDGPLPIRELMQMMGRAGRRDQKGWSAVVLKPRDAWEKTEGF